MYSHSFLYLRDELRVIGREDVAAAVERLEEQLKALEPPKDGKVEHVQEMEEVHADLERRNRYLMGELERRDKEKAADVRWPWWKWWR